MLAQAHRSASASLAFAALVMLAAPAVAQEREPRRVRVALGPELSPAFPGASGLKFSPFIEVDIARGDEEFDFEAPDESFGFPLLRVAGVEAGPSFNVEGKRKVGKAGPGMPEVDTSLELGGFVQYFPTKSLRLRVDIRHGVTGHEALNGTVSADWIARDGDKWLVSLGPRITLGSTRHQQSYFGVSAAESAASGLPIFTADAGAQAVGGTAGFIRQINPRWSLHGYARYDRLVGDAASSPIVRTYGSRNQVSGGLAISYTFSMGRR